MFGTRTLAEIKKELIARYGCLPGESAEIPPSGQGKAVEVDIELEKSLNAALAELEREIQERKSVQGTRE